MSTYTVNPQSGCWEWQGKRAGKGYGVLSLNNHQNYVHRLSFRLFHGTIPEGLFVMHRCDNMACFNPEHLFLGSAEDNVADMDRKGRRKVWHPTGEKHPQFKYTDELVTKIRAEYEAGDPPRVLSQRYGIGTGYLDRIIHYRSRAGITPGKRKEVSNEQ